MKRLLPSLLCALTLLCTAAAHAASTTFNFSFTGTYSGSGTLTATPTATANQYLVTGISGAITGPTTGGVTYSSTLGTVLAPGTYPTFAPPTNDNLLTLATGSPFFDFSGVAFTDQSGMFYDLYLIGGSTYGEVASNSLDAQQGDISDVLTSLSITPSTPAVAVTPEPSSFLLLGTGVLGAAGTLRRRLAA